MQAALETISSLISLGGPVVAILLAASVLTLAVIILKLWQFFYCAAGNARPARLLAGKLKSGAVSSREVSPDAQKSAAAGAVALAHRLKARGDLGKADIEEEVSQYAALRLHRLQSGFRLLDAVSQLAPLLGLFGTVLGMIDAFQQLQGAGANVDPSLLAGGIWVALLTTAAGLAVAMPVSLILTFLETRVESERINIESLVGELLSPIHETGLPSNAATSTERNMAYAS